MSESLGKVLKEVLEERLRVLENRVFISLEERVFMSLEEREELSFRNSV